MLVKRKSISYNFIMNVLLTMSSVIFPLLTFPYVSRILTPIGVGKVSFATSLITYFTMFSQLGVPTYGIRACAKVRDDKERLSKTVHELLVINLVTCFVSYIGLAVSLMLVPRLQQEKPLYVVLSLGILLNSIGVEWLYKALEEYKYIALRSIVFKFIALILMFFFVRTKDNYLIYGALSIFAASASNIFNFFYARKYIIVHPIGGYNFKQHFTPILIFFAMACAATIYTQVDTIMLGFMKTDADVGYYKASTNIKSVLVSLVTSLGAVLLPRLSYYVEHNRTEEFYALSKKALNFVIVISVPIVFYFILFAEQGIVFLSGKEYENAIIPMQILMPTVLLIGITNILGIQILVPMGKEKVVLCSEVIGAVVNIIINVILIPRYASAGAAAGTLIAEATVLVVQMIALRNDIKNLFISIQYWKIIFATMCGGIGTFKMIHLETSSFVVLMVSSCVFFGMYGVILTLLKETLIISSIDQIRQKMTRTIS